MMLTGGSIALAVQRKLATEERERSPREATATCRERAGR
jgi:hypothetical protein